jgi:hypothetical protein
MNFMNNKGVWDFIELPNNTRANGCKCIFKIKIDLLGKH